jgi:hypothetical protein
MNKYLYFGTAAVDDTASGEEVVMFPIDKLSHYEFATSTQLRAYFDAGQEVETTRTLASNAVNKTVVVMTVATGKHKEALQDIASAVNAHPNGDPCVVIADSENTVFASAHITACASIDVIDAS